MRGSSFLKATKVGTKTTLVALCINNRDPESLQPLIAVLVILRWNNIEKIIKTLLLIEI